MTFCSGQFAFASFRQRGLREPHPFTLSSAPDEPVLRLTVKELGDYTCRLAQLLASGRTCVVEGGYGMLDYRAGGRRQLWIAGGIGVTPFLSWLRDTADDVPRTIDFCYAVRQRDEAVCWEEVLAARSVHPGFDAHLHVSSEKGTLTVRQFVDDIGPLADRDVYLCGPGPMIDTLTRGLREHGVAADAIHFEEFSFR